MGNYHEDIQRWRNQREANYERYKAKELEANHADVAAERDHAIAQYHKTQDPADKKYWLDEATDKDNYLVEIEQDYRELHPPETFDPTYRAMMNYTQRRSAYIEKYGERATKAMDMAHAYCTRPRTGSKNPAQTGMGLTPGTQPYFRNMDALMELYAKDATGAPFDPNVKALTAQEAAKISGVDSNTYNRASQQLYNQQRFEFQKKGS